MEPDFEREISRLPKAAARRVRLMLEHRGPWAPLERSEGWPRGSCPALIGRLPAGSPLAKHLEALAAIVPGDEDARCPRCSLRLALRPEHVCLASVVEHASRRSGVGFGG